MKLTALVTIVSIALVTPRPASADGTTFLRTQVAASAPSDWIFDFDSITRSSLGQHWDAASPQQRRDFSEALSGLVRRSFKKHLSEIRGHTAEFLGEVTHDGIVSVEVRTVPANRSEEPVDIVFKLRPDAGSYLVVDVVVEESSMVDNYRKQFHKIVTRDGLDSLIKKLKDKLRKNQ